MVGNGTAHFGLAFLHRSAEDDCRKRHLEFGAIVYGVDREDVIPTIVVSLKGSHMLGLHPFLHGVSSNVFEYLISLLSQLGVRIKARLNGEI